MKTHSYLAIHRGRVSMNRVKNILIILVFYISVLGAQGSDQTPLLDRFSLTISNNYHYNPWDDYNNAIATIAHQVELDNSFRYPKGVYEKIIGDNAITGVIEYNIIKSISVLIAGQSGAVRSIFEFYIDTTQVPPEVGGSPTFHQKIAFDFSSIGFGFSTDLKLRKDFTISPYIILEQYNGALTINWKYSLDYYGPIPPDERHYASSKLSDVTWGQRLGINLNWEFYKNLSIFFGIDYRQVKFNNMQGTAQYGLSNSDYNEHFNAELVTAANYFGIQKIDDISYLPWLTFYTEPSPYKRKPVTLDLSGFGFQFGIQFRI